VDAELYARHGHVVDAYDHDPDMREYFTHHCHALIAEGRIRQRQGSYEEFLAGRDTGWADLITSNFAPLNLVDDLVALFRRLHELSRGRARILASVLNPLAFRDFRYPWWRQNLGKLIRHGEFFVEGQHGRVYRRSVNRMAELAAPGFRLLGAIPNAPNTLKYVQSSPTALVTSASRRLSFSPYVMLVLERVDAGPSSSPGVSAVARPSPDEVPPR
jgi:hypothetical protein